MVFVPAVVVKNVAAELLVLVPVAVVCQFQVSFAAGVPLRVKVTPKLEHCGESLVGFAGVLGNEFTVIAITADVSVSELAGLVHVLVTIRLYQRVPVPVNVTTPKF